MMNRLIRIAVYSCTLTILVSTTAEGHSPPPVLNPKTYDSPSGEYSLKVDPSTKYGQHEGHHTLSKNGKTVWSKELPFTLWNAAVTDKGVVVGYAYSHGYQGFPSEQKRETIKRDNWNGVFHIVILEPDGEIRLNQVEKRENSLILGDDTAYPAVKEILTVFDQNQFLLRMIDRDMNRNIETWRVIRISDGKTLNHHQPRVAVNDILTWKPTEVVQKEASDNAQPGCGYFENGWYWRTLECQQIPGTPLILTHWVIFSRGGEADDGVFALISLDSGMPVWTLYRPCKYSTKKENNSKSLREQFLDGKSGILKTGPDGTFTLWLPSEKASVDFSVSLKDSEWTVRETGRKEYKPQEPPSKVQETAQQDKSTIPTIQLNHLGDVKLQAQVASEPEYFIFDFDIDDQGNIGSIRRAECDDRFFILTNGSGEPLFQVPLTDNTETNMLEASKVKWWHNNLWLVTTSSYTKGNTGKLWVLDSKSRAIRKHNELKGLNIDSIGSLGPKGYVLLTHNKHFADRLIAFDASGKQKWMIKENSGDTRALSSPEGVTVTSTGEIAVLENIKNQVRYYDQKGKFLHTLDLTRAFGKEPGYPSRITADNSGGIIIQDFSGKPPIWHLNSDGKVINSFKPAFSNKRILSIEWTPRMCPDGRIWYSDIRSICRLTKEGVVDLVLGNKPTEELLSGVVGFTTDQEGNIFVVSNRTGCVHVFDTQGKLKHICKTIPTDFPSDIDKADLTIDGKENVYVCRNSNPSGKPKQYIHFTPDGTRTGISSLKNGKQGGKWQFKPGTQQRWIRYYDEIQLISPEETTIRSLKKRPDGDWLGSGIEADVAPDGSIAVFSRKESRSGSRIPTVSIFDPEGEPVKTIPVAYEEFLYNTHYSGRYVIWNSSTGNIILDTKDASIKKITYGQDDLPGGYREISPDGTELWILDSDTLSIHRFELPQTKR